MIPTVVIIGRPNVGKSTLFNRLTRSRDAIVADMPGLTRDRHYGRARIGEKPCIVVDTGGFEPKAGEGMLREMARQTEQAIAESDTIVFIVDGRQGVAPQDFEIAARLRVTGRAVHLVVNKTEGLARDIAGAEFHELGLGDPLPVSAAHGDGVDDLMELVLAPFAPTDPSGEDVAPDHPSIAIVGRPNVGKSTLANRLLGEERMIVFDQPGTTRDSIHADFERKGRRYTLIDTAGIRRRGKVEEAVEKFSVIKTLQSIEACNVAVLVLDAREEIADQDAHIAGFILEAGRALVVAVNKWDDLETRQRDSVVRNLERKLAFLDFAPMHRISAREGTNIDPLMRSVDAAFASAMVRMSTPRLNRILREAVVEQAPPRSGLVRPKLRYAHQGGTNPPVVVVHGTALQSVPDSYWRFLSHRFSREFELVGTPLQVQFRKAANPYVPERTGARRVKRRR
jgi:GTP-binding protein